MRRSLSPGAALTSFRAAMELDVADVLAAVRVPTLVIPRPALPGPGHFAAERIRGAELADLPPLRGVYTWVDDEAHRATMEATADFVARLSHAGASERVLATILFTDIVGSTELAARVGDSAWRELLQRHHAIVRRELARYQGRELDTAGDGFFAAFDGPARAVQAASAIRDALPPLGIEIRAGLHTGECEVHDGKLAGIAVSTGARISSLAGPEKCSSQARSRTSSPARASRSRIEATTSSRASPTRGASSPSLPDDRDLAHLRQRSGMSHEGLVFAQSGQSFRG